LGLTRTGKQTVFLWTFQPAFVQSREQYNAVWHFEQGFNSFSVVSSSTSGLRTWPGLEQCAHLLAAGCGLKVLDVAEELD